MSQRPDPAVTAPWGLRADLGIPSGGGAPPARRPSTWALPPPGAHAGARSPRYRAPPPARWAPLLPAGLRQRRDVPGKSAVFSGEHFVLEETDWYLLNLFRLWWHYGISFLRLQMWVEEVMEKFMR